MKSADRKKYFNLCKPEVSIAPTDSRYVPFDELGDSKSFMKSSKTWRNVFEILATLGLSSSLTR